MQDNLLVVYTDGSVLRPVEGTSPGGWAYGYSAGGKMRVFSGGALNVTNNQMEILASIKAMQRFERLERFDLKLEFVSDSQYHVNGANDWMHTWVRKNWGGFGNTKIKNAEYWKELYRLHCLFDCKWRWVRGHNGHAQNEIMDKAAKQAARRALFHEKLREDRLNLV